MLLQFVELESRCACQRTEGSNPSLSAIPEHAPLSPGISSASPTARRESLFRNALHPQPRCRHAHQIYPEPAKPHTVQGVPPPFQRSPNILPRSTSTRQKPSPTSIFPFAPSVDRRHFKMPYAHIPHDGPGAVVRPGHIRKCAAICPIDLVAFDACGLNTLAQVY